MPSTTLFCLPPAGAGAAFFRPWVGRHPGLLVVPVEFPGRGKRFTEPERTDLDGLLEVLVPEMLEASATSERVVVLGHCFGAVVAHRAVRAMARRRPGLDLTLVVSGSGGPGSADQAAARERRVTGLPDDEFAARVQEISGYSHPALADPALHPLVLPPLRTDVAMHESHAFPTSRPLSLPVLAVRGSEDDRVSAKDAGTWRSVTTGRFRLAEIDGGHMYLTDRTDALLQLIAEETHPARAAR
ncbi:thioesterase II family protein [Streptomyces fragilis]|uniref:Alpha/beta fold hydrolase n=1 Tax=Streptomyces fragilis TaxID=67301 RepID=A0ABV2YGH2_9ACTN|nr:alpha/beta fold hydrolase [Streptomyces fragilis]